MKITALLMILMGMFNASAAEVPEDVSAKNIIRNRIQENAHQYKIDAAKGDPKAQFQLGEFYHWGMGVKRNMDKAIGLYNSASQNGNREASYKLGEMYHFGRSVKRNPTTSLSYYRRAALQGHWDAQCLLANYYFTGKIKGMDVETEQYMLCACTFYELAVAQKLPPKLHNLGLAYYKHLTILPKWIEDPNLSNFEKAINWLWDTSIEGHVENTILWNLSKKLIKKFDHFSNPFVLLTSDKQPLPQKEFNQVNEKIKDMNDSLKDLEKYLYSEP